MYELWDTDTFNIVASFPTEDAALASVQTMADTYGDESIADWSLILRDGTERGDTIAYGRGLLDRARQMMPT